MKIGLGVSGGIAAYKACEIVRGLDKAGVEVHVVMTENATRFITPLTLQTLSRNPVLVRPFDLETAGTVRHIDAARALSCLLVAPATANVIAKFAHGIADDLLSTLFTAVVSPVVLAPAMNTRMWSHAATRANVATLRSRGVAFVDPEEGWLAEQETGWGRLADPVRIVEAALRAGRRSESLAGKTVIVAAGPTREPIDPVRFLSNASSGKMGYALAAAAARRGARTVLVSGPVSVDPPHGVEVVPVETSAEMRDAVMRARDGAALILMAAAVSDFVPRRSTSKIKKEAGPPALTLERGPDILAELGRTRGSEILVGFAAETEDLLANAKGKLVAKGADFIVANDVSDPRIGIGSDRNAVTILGRDGSSHEIPEASKVEVAEAILDRVLGADA